MEGESIIFCRLHRRRFCCHRRSLSLRRCSLHRRRHYSRRSFWSCFLRNSCRMRSSLNSCLSWMSE